MNNDRFAHGPPLEDPPDFPKYGTKPLAFLESRAVTDPVAKACLDQLRCGVPESDVLMLALHAYANGLDATRRQLVWYTERYASPLIVATVRGEPR